MIFTFNDRISPTQILFEADGKGGGGGGGNRFALPDDIASGLRSLINKEGSDAKALAKLYEENYELRKDKRELQDELDNSNTLSDEEYEQYQAYQELGEDPEELEEKLEKGQEAIEKNATYKQEKSNREVAEVMGWNPKTLNRVSGEDAEYEIKTRKNDEGEDEKYVVLKTEDGEKDLAEHAKSEWDDVLPALEATDSGDEEDESSSGKSFTKQKSSGDGKSNDKDPVAARLKRNKKEAGLLNDEE